MGFDVDRNGLEGLWTIEDVAKYCRVKGSVVRCWLRNLDLPYVRLGKFYRFVPEDIVAWVRKNRIRFTKDKSKLKLLP